MSWEYAQWFDPLGSCRKCGKAATGILRDHRNSSVGAFCERCAESLVKKAHKKGKFHPDAVYEAAPSENTDGR
jgi:hypothetical protein